MLSMINEFRTGSDAWAWNESGEKDVYAGLNPLTYDYKLEQVAMQRAAEIAVSFSHTRLDGSSKAWDSFSGWTNVGENIAAGNTTASSAFVSWQETNESYARQGHRRNMLNREFTAVGIGHVVCNGVHFWVQVFCAPVLDSAQTAAVDSARDVELTVANSIISQKGLSASPTSITLHPGESVALPSATASIGTQDTWPKKQVPVKASGVSWSTANSGVASVSGGKVVANKVGNTTLTANAQLGGAVSASVSVNVVAWDISTASISGLGSAVYNGAAQEPAPKVTIGSNTLKAGTDYSVSYKNNVNAGTATVTVTGAGNYSGQKSATFKITPAPMSNVVVKGIGDKAYTGGSIAQTATVYYGITSIIEVSTGDTITQTATVSDDPRMLKAGTDYSVSYKNNVNAGTASVTFAGKGNYSGTKTVTFAITPASLSDATVSGIENKTYSGNAKKQSAQLKFGSKTLKAGTDYSVSYKNNVKAGTASVVFTGKGNFKGTLTKKFKIEKAKNPLKASAKAKTLSVKYNKKKAITLKRAKAFKVAGNKGTLTFKKTAGNSKIKVSKAGKITVAKGTKRKQYQVTVKVTAAGNANYKKGSRTVKLKIVVN